MNSISAIRNLYAYNDGDTVTPAMGVRIDAGYGLHQYFNPTTKQVVATDFTQHNAILFPQPYSSKLGSIIVPETVGQQWYYNNISSEGAILENGAVKSAFASIFELTSVTLNGSTFPALKIKGNLANENDYTDKYIYYRSTYRGMTIVCQQLIPIQAAVGDAYKVLLSVEGDNGIGDNVLSNDNDWVKYTANLQLAGQTVANGVTFAWQRLVNGAWQTVTHVQGLTEISGATSNVFKVFNAAVEGVEEYRCVATYNHNDYYEVFQVTDIHDPFYIDDGCSHPGDAVKVGETVTFTPKVYDRSTGDLSTGWTFTYTLTKRADGTVISDVTVNTLTYDNIDRYGGINVRTEASR